MGRSHSIKSDKEQIKSVGPVQATPMKHLALSSCVIYLEETACFPYTDLYCSCLPGGQSIGYMLMQCTRHGKTKTALLVYLVVVAVFCPSICLPLQRLPSSQSLSLSFPQEDLWRLTSLVKAHESNEQKPQPILPSSTPFCYFTVAYCQHSCTWFSVYDVTIRGSVLFWRVSDMSECSL